MTDVAIKVENLSKRYRIGSKEKAHDTLVGAMAGMVQRPIKNFKRLRRLSKFSGNGHESDDIIWALKDVSFDVKRGEVLGIIGRNGAGKSTLLKILTRITEPNEGYARITGRVASLLEVGTGFHPELTGRENIYLNGTILGMTRKEVVRKFDEIVDFAGVEKFIDTPVKRYSSGMKVRLAFAVAVHLEPEILLVDEVLAVGDAEFQRKCFNKMREVAGGKGRTILFVSHNMSAIRQICERGVILQDGRLIEQGPINDVVDRYVASTQEESASCQNVETKSFVVDNVRIFSPNGPVIKTFDPVEIRVKFTVKIDILDPGVYVAILNMDNDRLVGLDLRDFQTVPALRAGEKGDMGFFVKELPILPGSYHLEVILKDLYHRELVPRTYGFEVAETPVYGGRKIDNLNGFIGLHAEGRVHHLSREITAITT